MRHLNAELLRLFPSALSITLIIPNHCTCFVIMANIPAIPSPLVKQKMNWYLLNIIHIIVQKNVYVFYQYLYVFLFSPLYSNKKSLAVLVVVGCKRGVLYGTPLDSCPKAHLDPVHIVCITHHAVSVMFHRPDPNI